MKQTPNFILLLIFLALFTNCNSAQEKHLNATEIYNSGEIKSLKDFILVAKDERKSVIEYRYKYDTLLIVQKHYDDNWQWFRGYSFYYKSVAEGKWQSFSRQNNLRGEVNYIHGKRSGLFLGYSDVDSHLVFKEYYQNDTLLYSVRYGDRGQIFDSVHNK